MASWTVGRGPGHSAPGWPWILYRASEKLQERPKSAPRAPRSAPRAAKSAPRASKSVPRAAKIHPRMPKSAPRAPKIAPRAQKQPKTRENMKNHAKPHKNAQKHTKHTQKHKRTHNDDTSRVFGFGCDVGFDCGSCLGWTKHAGHVIPFAVQPMQEPQAKAISQPKPKNRDMSSCCVGATLPYLSRLRGGISKADAQEVPKRGQKPPKSEQKPVK